MGYSGAVLKNSEGKILFQERDGNGKNPYKWGLFGGGIEKSETPLEAIIRELKEELGVVISKSDVIEKYKIPFFDYHIFEIKLRKTPKKSNLKEGKDMKFMTKREFIKTKNALWRVKIFLRLFRIN